MAFFKKLWAVAFSGPKSGNDTGLSEISNDELVTAYEWLTEFDGFGLLPGKAAALGYSQMFHFPAQVHLTIEKLGAA